VEVSSRQDSGLPEELGLPEAVLREVVGPAREAFGRLVAVMAKLRSPEGCPWDREQTHASLARNLLEETYEVLEAIDAGDHAALREELGDLVLQVVFHAQLAYEEGEFTVAHVLEDLRDKLVRRHPHVFGGAEVSGAEQVLANWERIKRAEKGSGVMDGVPAALPALARATKLSRRAAQVGFDAPSVEAAAAEVDAERPDHERLQEALGGVLFAVCALGRKLGLEPETALRRTAEEFARRFRALETLVRAGGRSLESLSPEEWAEYWDLAKAVLDGPTHDD
jgi:tetrapyrrole methylase family protein/MazG family protein